MGEKCILNKFLGSDFRSFLHLDSCYFEPQPTSGQLRLFIYLDVKLTGALLPPNKQVDVPLPSPALNGSL